MWTETIRAIPLAATLLMGLSQQTHSECLKPMPISDRLSEGSLSLKIGGFASTPSSTGRTGTRLSWDSLIEILPTGGYLILQSPVLPRLTDVAAAPTVAAPQALPATRPLPEHARAVEWLTNVAGLSADRVGGLIGASRVSVQHWKTGASIRDDNLRRLMETHDVLRRAMRQRPERDALAAWLVTPDPHEGVSPEQLLKQGEFNRARMLAVLSPSDVEPMPVWAKRPVAEPWREVGEQRQRPGEFFDDLT